MTVFICVAAIIIIIYVLAVCISFDRIFVRRKIKISNRITAWSPFQTKIDSGIKWIRAQNCEKVELISFDGLRLAARLLPAENARGTIILMHGYKAGMYRDFSCVYEFYHGLGFNLLIPSQRAHGESEGKYICFGVKERFDCRQWAHYVRERFGEESDIFLSGLSMGCSTVLMASNLDLPENVRGIIADCGFTSAWDELSYLLKRIAHLPPHPFLDGLSLMTKLTAGFGLKECSAEDCVAETKIPILFVHGKKDTFVPHEFGVRNFNACASEKKFISVEEANHGVSYLVETDRCKTELTQFIERYSKCAD